MIYSRANPSEGWGVYPEVAGLRGTDARQAVEQQWEGDHAVQASVFRVPGYRVSCSGCWCFVLLFRASNFGLQI